MEELQKLELTGSSESIQQFVDYLSKSLNNGWWRDYQDEQHANRDRSNLFTTISVRTPGIGPLNETSMYLHLADDNTKLSVWTVIQPPGVTGADTIISTQQKNQIIERFYQEYIRNQTEKYGILVERSTGAISVDTLMMDGRLSEAGARLIKEVAHRAVTYGSLANGHDESRWYDFICLTHLEQKTLDNNILRKLLTQLKVPAHLIDSLPAEYERLSLLLSHYDVFRADHSG